jgi:anti-sigma factor RsiW
MKCGIYQKEISLLLDGILDEPALDALRAHLDACPECRRVYDGMTAVNERLRSAPIPCPHGGLAERVKERIASRGQYHVGGRSIPLWGSVPLVAFLVLAALGLGNLAGQSLTGLVALERPESRLELLVADNGNSFADVMLDMHGGEGAR